MLIVFSSKVSHATDGNAAVIQVDFLSKTTERGEGASVEMYTGTVLNFGRMSNEF